MANRIFKNLVLFLVGALVGTLGDYLHVVSKTTFYNPEAMGFKILESAWWFPFSTGIAAIVISFLSRKLQPKLDSDSPALRTPSIAFCVFGVLFFLFVYTVSSFPMAINPIYHNLIMVVLAFFSWRILQPTWTAFLLGILFALLGTGAEIMQIRQGLFGYWPRGNEIAGVAIWLPCLYFASVPPLLAISNYLVGAEKKSA